MQPRERHAWRGVVAFNLAFSAWLAGVVGLTAASMRYPGLSRLTDPMERLDITFIALSCVAIGMLVWWWDRRRITSYPRCSQCGYNLTGHVDLPEDRRRRCPECGELLSASHIIAAAQPDFPRADRRLLRLAFVAASVATVSAAGAVVLLVCTGQFKGWEFLVLPVSCAFLWACPLLIRRARGERV